MIALLEEDRLSAWIIEQINIMDAAELAKTAEWIRGAGLAAPDL
jgi:hypothetical protein